MEKPKLIQRFAERFSVDPNKLFDTLKATAFKQRDGSAPTNEQMMALKLARSRLSKGRKIEQPSSAFSYLQTLMHEYEHEVFGALFLDTKHRVILFEELFKGTLDAASVYPREVIKRALELNAASDTGS